MDVVLEELYFADLLVKKLKMNTPDDSQLVELIANENDSVSVSLNFLTNFSSMMKCMLIGSATNSERMEEARNFQIHIDPKFSIAHLKHFLILIFGTKEERIELFSNQSTTEFLKEIYEFLDMYGFELWKPAVMKRIFQLVPHNHRKRKEISSWSLKFGQSDLYLSE
jgi:hypothetical protein